MDRVVPSNVRALDGNSVGWEDGVLKRLAEMSLSLMDPTFASGLGLFETLVRRGSSILDLDRHLTRLRRSASGLRLDLPSDVALTDALEAVASLGVDPGWLKIVISAGGRAWVYGGGLAMDPEGQPATVVTLPWRRNALDPLAGLKTLNYASNLHALAWAHDRGVDEGVWLNTQGHLAEGCRSNVAVIQAGALYTARVREGILPGTVRDVLLEAASELSIPVHRGRVRPRRVASADEALMTSSLGGVRPIVSWDRKPLSGGKPGKLTLRLAERVRQKRLAAAHTFDPSDPS